MGSAELRRVDDYQPGTLPVFVQGSDRPIFHGGGSETWSCGNCSTVLLRDIHVDAFWDVAFRCFTCSSVWLSPSRPAGKPVPQAGIFVHNGEYLIKSETIPLGEAGFFGPGAHESRDHEIGKRPSGSRVADEAFLRKLADRGEALLASKFGKLHQSYLRGRQSKTPPKDPPHRLVDLIFKVRSAVGTTGTPGVYLHELVELSAAVEMCERWSKDPELPKIINGLKNATDFPHALIVLSMASLLADHGNAVELVPAEKGKRTPDLRLHLNRRRRMNVEVKVPQGLIGPRNPLTVDDRCWCPF